MKRVKVNFNFKSMALVLFALVLSSNVWGGTTVTYKQSSTSAASVDSGTAPTGSSVTFSNTYSTKEQLTNGNSMTYTLKGYAGCKITSLTMSMKSNSKGGSGTFSFVAGSTTLAEIASNTAFNNAAWHGSWSTSYVDVTPTMTKSDYAIKTGEDVVLTISASANSLYCQSITITYEATAPSNPYTVTFYTASGVSQAITEASAGAGVTPPSMEQTCGDYTFAGWSKTQRLTEVTTATTIETLTTGKYYPTANTTLYPIYSKTGGGTSDFSLSVTSGSFRISSGGNYATGDISGTSNGKYSSTTDVSNARMFTFTKVSDGVYTIYDESKKDYVKYSSSTDLAYNNGTAYNWTITADESLWNLASSTSGRYFSYRNTGVFGGYASTTGEYSNVSITGTSSTYYFSYPSCGPTCTTSPSVSAGAISGATTSSLTFNCAGGITSLGSAGCEITEYGYVYGTSENPTTSNTKYKVGESYTTTGTAFAAYTAMGLNCGTTYYMRPYAINGNGPAYGAQVSLATLDCPVDHFIDNIQETTGYTGDGKAVSTSYTKASITLYDKAAATSESCEDVHYHFVGWVTAADRSAGNVDAEHIVNFQTSGNTPTGATYYAVWAAEQE